MEQTAQHSAQTRRTVLRYPGASANPGKDMPTISKRISKSRQTPTKQGFWTYSPGRLAPKIWIWLRWNDGFGEKWQSYVAKSRSGQSTRYPKPLQEACLEHKAITIFYSSKDLRSQIQIGPEYQIPKTPPGSLS